MEFLKPENLAAASGLLVPGLVAMLVYDQLVPYERRDWSKHTLEVVAFGAGHYLLFSPAFKWLARQEVAFSWRGVTWLLGTIVLHFVAPVCWAFLTFWTRKRLAARGWITLHPTPTAWDHVFGTLKGAWLRVKLRDGTRVGGRWEAGAFAGTSVTKRDLYLKAARPIGDDGRFGDDYQIAQELLIREEEIGLIEILPDPPPQEDAHEQEDAVGDAADARGDAANNETARGRLPASTGQEGLQSSRSSGSSSATSDGADSASAAQEVGKK